MPFSQAQDRYIAPARLRPQLWRLVLGVGLILVIYLAWMAAIGFAVTLAVGLDDAPLVMGQVGLGATPPSIMVLLFTFAGLVLGTFAAVRWVHKRPVASLFGPRDVLLRDFAVALGLFLAVSVPGVVWVFASGTLSPGVPVQVWAIYAIPVLLGLIVQTGAEEIVFRGYLQQQLAARFAARWVSFVIPSVLFGLLHYAPDQMGQGAWLLVGLTGFFGLLMADLTARSGSLGMAWGLHFGNNTLAILIFTTGEALDGVALFRLPYSLADPSSLLGLLLVDLLGLVLIWALLRRWLRGR
ncbi:CPBP family intramembrane glutamic endopeptidase [Roseibaca sp. Y0-43]|uniref:CPBP family intramembrane glutamic endopeptidase n=1 Tax=Roseibaca sp. Y0-43 TaxID=2816854 RepID=UPI001D0C264C|nr:type II CAAX endopeptidase family protein [Roseibaca sp. Y0-43]MCC1481905.1 CPBP family intramembrane metalloprotease [Roseibaca sp. Y0-43]